MPLKGNLLSAYLFCQQIDKYVCRLYPKKIEYLLLADQCIVYSTKTVNIHPVCDLEEVNMYG